MPFTKTEEERIKGLKEEERPVEYAKYFMDFVLSPEASLEQKEAGARLTRLHQLWGLDPDGVDKIRRKVTRTLGQSAGFFFKKQK